jgi:hypothetical protein
MPSSHRQKSPAPGSRISGLQQYTKLENRLVLLAWLNSLLGYESNRKLLEDTQTVAEGFGADGHSFLYHHLIARGNQVKISKDDLARYDKNIRVHLEKINSKRTEPITLRYFQSLAALYTEIFLDRLLQPSGATAGRPERLCGEAQRPPSARRAAGRPLHEGRPDQIGLLDGHRQRQNAHPASELPPVPDTIIVSPRTTSCSSPPTRA